MLCSVGLSKHCLASRICGIYKMENHDWHVIHQDTHHREGGCAAIQRDCDRLESQEPNGIQPMEVWSPAHDRKWSHAPVQTEADLMESSFAEKDLEVLVKKKWNMSQ